MNNFSSSPTTNTLINYSLISARLVTSTKSGFKSASLGHQSPFSKHMLGLMKLNI